MLAGFEGMVSGDGGADGVVSVGGVGTGAVAGVDAEGEDKLLRMRRGRSVLSGGVLSGAGGEGCVGCEGGIGSRAAASADVECEEQLQRR